MSSYGIAEDSLRCDEIWQRVLPGMEPYPQIRKQREGRLSEKDILSFMESECSDRQLYSAMARKGRTRAESRCLAAIGAAKACHAKKLEAVYFIMTGSHPCPAQPPEPNIRCLTDALRQRYYDELKAQQQYLEASKRAEDERISQLLSCLAGEEKKHGDIIWSLLV